MLEGADHLTLEEELGDFEKKKLLQEYLYKKISRPLPEKNSDTFKGPECIMLQRGKISCMHMS